MKKLIPKITAIVIIAFGLLTLFLSTSVIFDLFGIREKEGNYVLFVVWANFVSSILYLFSGFGLLKFKKWTTILLGSSFVILTVAYVGLQFHILSGGIYETKTNGAMLFRMALTLVFTIIASIAISKNRK